MMHARTFFLIIVYIIIMLQLCKIAPRTIKYKEMLTFFVNKWAPAVNELHQDQGGLVGKFLLDVVGAIKDLPIHEVWCICM